MSNSNSSADSGLIRFADLLTDESLIKNLASLNILEPTEVQSQAIPAALAGRDLIVEAQTGSGKTLAFMLPTITKILAMPKSRKTAALIVTPTRELAMQVKAVVESLGTDIVPACLIGGMSGHEQEKQLKKDARLVIGTPGRIIDFLWRRLITLQECRTLVLDEADEMLSMGFLKDVVEILDRLSSKCQGMFFSATITQRVLSLANEFLADPEKIMVEKDTSMEPKIEHLYCSVDAGVTSKINVLCKMFSESPDDSAIIFCNTKSDTELVEVCLLRHGFKAAKMNSDLSQKERNSVLSKIHSGELKYLVATDVAARGIDIKDLEMVINYSLPKEPEIYVHRTGRTGRAGAFGKAISIISPVDMALLHGLRNRQGIEMREIQGLPSIAA